METRADQIYT
uniref:Uncharacterized protein n=1 Tax=Arundo donax TaxID=35708 RepID=A0A0A9FD91_ARUDO